MRHRLVRLGGQFVDFQASCGCLAGQGLQGPVVLWALVTPSPNCCAGFELPSRLLGCGTHARIHTHTLTRRECVPWAVHWAARVHEGEAPLARGPSLAAVAGSGVIYFML
eukprot:1160274-Pelagomonas_calceolata.AAC.11